MKFVIVAPASAIALLSLAFLSYSLMKNMNPPPPAPETFPPMAPLAMAVLYRWSISGLVILSENFFLYSHDWPSSRPASSMSPCLNAARMSLARAFDLSRASSFLPSL